MTIPSEVQRKPDGYLTSLTSKQQRAYRQLQKLLADSRNGDLGWYYSVGEAFAMLHPAGTGYGDHWVSTCLSTLKCSRELAYRSLRLVKNYSRDEIEILQRQGLPWNSVVCLLTVKNPKLRQRLQERAIAKDWSYRRLKVEVLRATGCRPPRGGRRISPTDHGAQVNLRRLTHLTQQWLDHDSHLWSVEDRSLDCQCEELPAKEKTLDLLEEVRRVRRQLKRLQTAAGRLHKVLDRVVTNLERELQRRE